MFRNPLQLKPAEELKLLETAGEVQAPRHAGNTPYRLLDAWRGVAALWVVLLHIRLHTLPAPLYAFGVGGLLGVPMFFVISGYCIAHAAARSLDKPRPALHFVRARVRRIYPPYLLASLVAALLSLLLTALVAHHVVKSSQIAEMDLRHQRWQFYVGALTLMQVPLHAALIVRVFWSLCYEAAFYAAVTLLLLIAVRTRQQKRLLDAFSVLTVAALVWLGLAGTCPFPWDLWPQFGLGALVYQIPAHLTHLLALRIVTQGLSRLHLLNTHSVLLFLLKLALCVAAGRLFFQFCERPFLDSHQRQVQQEQVRQEKRQSEANSLLDAP